MSEQTWSSEETAPLVGLGVEWDDEKKGRRWSRSAGINCILKDRERVVVGRVEETRVAFSLVVVGLARLAESIDSSRPGFSGF